jgi:hypothetical protein
MPRHNLRSDHIGQHPLNPSSVKQKNHRILFRQLTNTNKQRGSSSTSCTDTDLEERINWGGRQVDNVMFWTATPPLYHTSTCPPLNGPDSLTFRTVKNPNKTPFNTKHPRSMLGGFEISHMWEQLMQI